VQADYALFGPGHATTRHDLDAILPDRPLALVSADHHTVWANTAALTAAGILHGGPVDAGSEIVIGPDGTATGELREFGAFGAVMALAPNGGREAAGLVTGADPLPAPGLAERAADAEVLRRGLRHCAAQGITGLHNMDGNLYQLELLAGIEAEGDLLCRVEVPLHLKSGDPLSRLDEAAGMRRRFAGDRLWCNRVKMFMDGVVESGTALMLRPYPGSDRAGEAVFEPDHFNDACIAADAMGLQISVHAIGDLAVRRTLDGFAAARAANGARDSRHRVEHIELLHPDDLPRFAELGAVASIQPRHAPFGGYFPAEGVERMLHGDQIPLAYAWRAIRAAGARVVFSTDWPVIPVDVMPSVQAAVAPLAMPEPWADNRQTLLETLESWTAGNAWVEFNEHRKGRLAPGMMADVAVMSHDLQAMAPDALGTARAVLTVCGGRTTWEA
jgi:predicted amidohydrolase YtcJ